MLLFSITQAVLAIAMAAPLDNGLPRPEHGLNFDTPVTVWDEALPLGNGILGALVWGDGHPLRISLDRTDLWDLRPVPEFHSEEYSYTTMRQWEKEGRVDDLLRVYDNPYNRPAPTRIPAGRIEINMGDGAAFARTTLSLADATGSMSFADGREVKIWVHGEQPVGMISMPAPGPAGIELVAPAFGGKAEGPAEPSIVAGELTQLGYPPPAKQSGDTFRAYEQEGWQGFKFAVYLGWRVTDASYTAAWSIASSLEGPDPFARAKQRVEDALNGDAAALRASHEAWWKNYWGKSWIAVPNPIIERQWFLETYKFGSASRKGCPPITLQGPWTADDGKLPPWKGDYHHDLNTELSYWPCYKGNRLEEGLAYLDWLWNTRDNCKEWTQRFFGMPGMNVPMTADLNNQQIGGWRQYTHSSTTAAWLAHHFYLHWRYTLDPQFLTDRAYPYLRDCAVFIEAITNERDADGKRTLPLSSSPEINDNRPNAWFPSITNYDLALCRWLLKATSELADEAGQAEDAKHWREVLSEMPGLSRGEDGRLLVAKDYPLPASHRHFSHLMAIHPLGLLNMAQGEEVQRTIRASLAELDTLGSGAWCGYSFSWLASLAARANDGAKAEKSLEIFSTAFTLRNSFHCNGDQSGKGYSTFTYRPFTLEGNFAAAEGLQEMLLQSHTGVIEVFPAIPESWTDAAFQTLRAEGAFLLSAERKGGKTVRVEIIAERGGLCRLRSPFSGKELQLPLEPGQKLALTEDPAPVTEPAPAPAPAPVTEPAPAPAPAPLPAAPQ